MSTAFRIATKAKLERTLVIPCNNVRSRSSILTITQCCRMSTLRSTLSTTTRTSLSLFLSRASYHHNTYRGSPTVQQWLTYSNLRRFMSTKVKEETEMIQGSMPAYNRHLVICTGLPGSKWTKKPELADPYHNLLMTVVRDQEVKVNFVDEPSDAVKDEANLLPTKGPRHDLILFPDNIKFKAIRYEAFKDLARYLQQYPVGTLRPAIQKAIADSTDHHDSNNITMELVPGSGELVQIELVPEPSAVLVCVHGARDCRCGEQGGELYRILKDMVQATGLQNSIKVYGVSHIGGHKWAPNTIMYPLGDWHGYVSEQDSTDAQQILFDALANGGIAADVREQRLKERAPIMIEKWRGRMGMTKEEQIKFYEHWLEMRKQQKQGLTARNQNQGQQQPQSLFSLPGEDLYEDDGLKEQRTALSVDSEKSSKSTVTAPTSTTEEGQRIKVIFESFQKVRTEINAKVGESILDIVKDKDPSRHDIYQALECTCGGQLECATCHVYIEPPFSARLPVVTDAEEDMLEYAVGRRETSRLGCQIKIKPELDGMIVKLPQY